MTFTRKRPERIKPVPVPVPVEHRRGRYVTPADLAQRAAPAAVESIALPDVDATWRSDAWLGAVRLVPCVHCGGHAEPAHRNEGKGQGLKTHDAWTAALCREEHRRLDQGGDLTREQRRSLMDRYIVLTLAELVKRGLVTPAKRAGSRTA